MRGLPISFNGEARLNSGSKVKGRAFDPTLSMSMQLLQISGVAHSGFCSLVTAFGKDAPMCDTVEVEVVDWYATDMTNVIGSD